MTTACSDSDPLETHGSGASNDESSTNVSGDGGNSNGNGTDGATGIGGTDADPTTGGPAPTREACDHYLDCLAVVSPAEQPTAQASIGPEGTCWDGPPESIEQCIQACVHGWEEMHDANPDEPACYLCAEDSDCAPGQACINGDCRTANCGDGLVDDDEVCDGQPDCEPDCSGNNCNPLSHAGCDGGNQCFVIESSPQCLPPQDGLPGAYEACVQDGIAACAAGLMCVPVIAVAECDPEASESCCTQMCNAQHDPDPCPGSKICQYVGGIEPPQDGYVGACITVM
ncbi:hypothetical protein SAMN02745121_08946 [Nannocystis exedens]|uniref:Uncharacterized protein n=1 Tax=Nannocystis exedens TaxID=54 RepID=A0A1I2ISB0_9BACT|nr:hypothetical protein [Nannocystis exedens]PCC69451.1 hypothetical protein NAEX_02473 [Nannocystis exedens]SFF45195.1 hypothetical protein SAMN02745121_08946 [Nannocystis exedens]